MNRQEKNSQQHREDHRSACMCVSCCTRLNFFFFCPLSAYPTLLGHWKRRWCVALHQPQFSEPQTQPSRRSTGALDHGNLGMPIIMQGYQYQNLVFLRPVSSFIPSFLPNSSEHESTRFPTLIANSYGLRLTLPTAKDACIITIMMILTRSQRAHSAGP